MNEVNVSMKINGKTVTGQVESRVLLAHFIREQGGLTGTHVGCDSSSCGVCTILLDGFTPVKSCTMYAVMADGHEITTRMPEPLPREGVARHCQRDNVIRRRVGGNEEARGGHSWCVGEAKRERFGAEERIVYRHGRFARDPP